MRMIMMIMMMMMLMLMLLPSAIRFGQTTNQQALVMEERLCVAAARMGEHTAEEMKKGHFFLEEC